MAQIRVNLSELIQALKPFIAQGVSSAVSAIRTETVDPNQTLPTARNYDRHIEQIRRLCERMQGLLMEDTERTIRTVKAMYTSDDAMSVWTRSLGEDFTKK